MLVIELKYIPAIKRYTTVRLHDRWYIKNINLYDLDHRDYKLEQRNMYITAERLAELQPEANKAGYILQPIN